jgi:hypothetical protein
MNLKLLATVCAASAALAVGCAENKPAEQPNDQLKHVSEKVETGLDPAGRTPDAAPPVAPAPMDVDKAAKDARDKDTAAPAVPTIVPPPPPHP